MVRYLAARTRFFDRTVVRALDRGMSQVVIAAAGYDGRALRYAKPGVRWFEVDHPDTQHDKQQRLDRLGVETSQVTFVPADFAVDDVAERLIDAGVDPGAPSLVLCEGVAIYLDRAVLESLLRQLRQVAAHGSTLAISLSIDANSTAQDVRREAFRAAVAAMGEPARTVLSIGETDDLLAATGWQTTAMAETPADQTQRARQGGLFVLEPF